MSNSVEESYNNEFTPEKLAEQIFSKKPKPKKSCQLILDQVDDEYVFELLLKILSNGINVLYGNEANISNIVESPEIKIILNEYFESMGFKLLIDIMDNNLDKDNTHYCEIKISDFPDYFIEYTKQNSGHSKYGNKYRFILNGKNSFIERNSLLDYYCFYLTNDKTKKIIIKFNYL